MDYEHITSGLFHGFMWRKTEEDFRYWEILFDNIMKLNMRS